MVIVHLDKMESGRPLKLAYRLKARFPIRARSPRSTAYQYYNPDQNAFPAPVTMEVRTPR